MKTTLLLPDPLFSELKRRALASGRTLTAVVAEALRRGLAPDKPPGRLRALPTFDAGRPAVDPADREALYRAMEGR